MGDGRVREHLHFVDVDAHHGVGQRQGFRPEVAGREFRADRDDRIGITGEFREELEDTDRTDGGLGSVVDESLGVRGQDDPGPERLRQSCGLLPRTAAGTRGTGPKRPGASDDERTLGGCNRLGGGVDLLGDRTGQGPGHGRVQTARTLSLYEVEGDLDRGRSRPARAHGRQGLPDCQGDFAGAGDSHDFGEHRGQRGGLVAHFVKESVPATGVGQRHAGGDEEDGHGIGEGLQQGGECVERGRARGRDDHLHLAGDAGGSIGHVARALLVAR